MSSSIYANINLTWQNNGLIVRCTYYYLLQGWIFWPSVWNSRHESRWTFLFMDRFQLIFFLLKGWTKRVTWQNIHPCKSMHSIPFPCVIPGRQKVIRQRNKVSWFPATSIALLAKWPIAMDGMGVSDDKLREAIRSVAFGLMNDRLTHAIPPWLGNNNGGWLEEDSVIQGLVQGVWAFCQKFLQKNCR